MTSKNRKWPGKTNFDVSLLKYLSDRNKTFATLILHIGLQSDKVWRILNFLILHVLSDYYRQPLLNRTVNQMIFLKDQKGKVWLLGAFQPRTCLENSTISHENTSYFGEEYHCQFRPKYAVNIVCVISEFPDRPFAASRYHSLSFPISWNWTIFAGTNTFEHAEFKSEKFPLRRRAVFSQTEILFSDFIFSQTEILDEDTRLCHSERTDFY
jgi:hypothetical protein